MWVLVSLYVLAYVAAGLIEAGSNPSRPRGFRVFDCLCSPYMNNFRSCAAFSHRRSAKMGALFDAPVIIRAVAGIPPSLPHHSPFGPPMIVLQGPDSGPVVSFCFVCVPGAGPIINSPAFAPHRAA